MSEENKNDEYVLSDMERRLTIAILENSSQANSQKIKNQIEALESGYVTEYPPRSISKEIPWEDLVEIKKILTMYVELKEIVDKFTVSERSTWSDEDKENWKNYGSMKPFPIWGQNEAAPWINSYCEFQFKSGLFRSIRRDFESTNDNYSPRSIELYTNMLEKYYARSYDGDLRPEDVAFVVNPELKYERNGRYS